MGQEHTAQTAPETANPKLAQVESFELDHTAVQAPYIRCIGTETGPKGDVISNFDVRLAQPNKEEIPTAALHTIEHTIAALLRAKLTGLIDISPFGCRTGFHLIIWGTPSVSEIAAAIRDALFEIAHAITWEMVPGTREESCGNYRDHSLHGAQEWAKHILKQKISLDPFTRDHTV